METAVKVLLLAGVISVSGCTPEMMGIDTNDFRAFNPHVAKDGTQGFTFVTTKKLPAAYGNADLEKVHEGWISNELGARQYCMKGYDLVKRTETEGNIVYEGVCK